MWGKATLAMLVSSTSMNAASETATAMTQGLPLGRQISSPELTAMASLIGPSNRLQRNRGEHRAAVVDFGATAFKGGFVQRDIFQLDTAPMFARRFRCEAVTYCLSEVASFSLIRHDNGYFIAGAAAAADVYRVLEFLIAACDDISQSFAEPRPEVAFCSLNTLRSFNQPPQAVHGRRDGLNLARHPGVDFQDARMGAFS